ncbi:hypothetical protein NA57DRAFT_71938 [Rhizodiscina lignyota]|uniref:Uncharacterized protein n=1 Tax=Rhizodiscina lignyota TaxID=1504668 RepID=A0A9P4MEU6_9PEZI|nr:hypothetical protein NA57DRAFT_71938 [Rhizodiscina lignyota]
MHVPRSSEDGGAFQHAVDHVLYARADDTSSDDKSGGSSKTIIIVVVVIVIVVIVLLVASYFIARRLRNRNASPKYLPGNALKNRWRRWASISNRNRGQYSDRLQPDASAPSLRPSPRSGRNSRSHSPALEELRTRDSSRSRETGTIGATVERGVEAGTRGTPADNQTAVDRHTSVRSIMTLPAYTPSARETEQILGREGERGGIDVVLEFPESTDEVEGRREEEMESLYQIRRARRAEAAEREERRRLRREARTRGDWAEVERLRVEERDRRQQQERQLLGEDPEGQRSAARLIAEHQEEAARRERQRRVSSVQYAELGVARHDGSRVRAGSNASARSEDNRPLLDSAADMGGDAGGRRGTLSTLDALSIHHRNRSASSVFSLSSAGTDDDEPGNVYHPPFAPPPDDFSVRGRGRSGSGVTQNTQNSSPDFEVVSLHSTADTPNGDRSTTPRPHSRAASASRLSHSITANDAPTITVDLDEVDLSRSQTAPETMETPIDHPPYYEHLAATEFGQPPDYESPVRQRAPQLPAITHVPSIRVSENPSPLRSPGGATSGAPTGESGDMGERSQHEG